ncbi:unnamed protein product [Closterium sp. NIES-54]
MYTRSRKEGLLGEGGSGRKFHFPYFAPLLTAYKTIPAIGTQQNSNPIAAANPTPDALRSSLHDRSQVSRTFSPLPPHYHSAATRPTRASWPGDRASGSASPIAVAGPGSDSLSAWFLRRGLSTDREGGERGDTGLGDMAAGMGLGREGPSAQALMPPGPRDDLRAGAGAGEGAEAEGAEAAPAEDDHLPEDDQEAVLDSVVKVFAVGSSPNYRLPWQNKPQREVTGSGFVIMGRRILTSAHIVADQAFVLVRKHGSPKKYLAQVQAVAHECDLALLTVGEPGAGGGGMGGGMGGRGGHHEHEHDHDHGFGDDKGSAGAGGRGGGGAMGDFGGGGMGRGGGGGLGSRMGGGKGMGGDMGMGMGGRGEAGRGGGAGGNEEFWAGLNPLPLGDVPQLQESVAVVGYPQGGDNISISMGVVSRVEPTKYAHSGAHLLAIQIDAAINPGNSGGPALVMTHVPVMAADSSSSSAAANADGAYTSSSSSSGGRETRRSGGSGGGSGSGRDLMPSQLLGESGGRAGGMERRSVLEEESDSPGIKGLGWGDEGGDGMLGLGGEDGRDEREGEEGEENSGVGGGWAEIEAERAAEEAAARAAPVAMRVEYRVVGVAFQNLTGAENIG